MKIRQSIQIAIMELENGMFLGQGILFPEISRFHDAIPRIVPGVAGSVSKMLDKLPIIELSGRCVQGEVFIHKEEIEINPVRRSEIWRHPLSLVFHAAIWTHGSGVWQAFIPALHISVAARNREELGERIPKQIASELHRRRIDLERAVRLQRIRRLHLRERIVDAQITGLKTRMEAQDEPDSKESELAKTGIELTARRLKPAFEADDTVRRLADILADPRPSSILIVGPSGVGKTAAVHEMIRRRHSLGLSSIRFFETGGAGIVAGQSGFGMWQDRCRKLIRECEKKGVVLVLGNLMELTDVGKSEFNTQGVAAFLRPHIQRGDIRVIVECTGEQLPLIEKNDPHLVDQFRQVRMENVSPELCRSILERLAGHWKYRYKIAVPPETLDEIIRMHRRFAIYSTLPGRPVRFLENLMLDVRKQTVDPRDAIEYFARETGLPEFMINDNLPLDLEKTENWFNSRVIGQEDAVGFLIAQLALVKTALSRPGKPLSSLLFIGPTGVGKTELAKVLAEFLFGDPERLIRFDMSEYANFHAVRRLAGDDAGKEGALTAKIREQPFSVLLLDELEKAHPLFFDLMLQVLGEGRLTDAKGRVADFSNTVVIMTSNLGAHVFQKGRAGFGSAGPGRAGLEQVADEVRAFFRPELVNRIDRIIPFYPLDTGTLVAIAKRMLEDIRCRDGIRQRNVGLAFDPDVIRYLAEKDHDPRYGARPLRRRIEREILAPLSEKLNAVPNNRTVTARIAVADDRLSVDTVPIEPKARKPTSFDLFTAQGPKQIIDKAMELRRRTQKVMAGQAVRTFQSDLFRYRRSAQQAHMMRKLGRYLKPHHEKALEKLPAMEDVASRLEDTLESINICEDEMMRLLFGGRLGNGPESTATRIRDLDRDWQDVLMSFFALGFESPGRICVAVYGEDRHHLFLLCGAYHSVFRKAGHEIRVYRLNRSEDGETGCRCHELKEPEAFIAKFGQSESVAGILFDISGAYAGPSYIGENGIHRFVSKNRKIIDCRVHCANGAPKSYRIPDPIFIDRNERSPRRTYRYEDELLIDHDLNKRIFFHERTIENAVKTVMEQCLAGQIEKLFYSDSE